MNTNTPINDLNFCKKCSFFHPYWHYKDQITRYYCINSLSRLPDMAEQENEQSPLIPLLSFNVPSKCPYLLELTFLQDSNK